MLYKTIISLLIVFLMTLSLYTFTIPPVYSQSGSPIPGAHVEIDYGPDPKYGLEVITNQNGEVILDLYRGVSHDYEVRARGYVAKNGSFPAVNNPGPVQQVITLEPAALIEGYVKTPDGRPVVGAPVDTDIDSTITDANGYFAVYAVPGRNATVSVNSPGVVEASFRGFFNPALLGLPTDFKDSILFIPVTGNTHVLSKRVEVVVNSSRVQLNITVDYSARVAGFITYQNGTAVPNAVITFINPNNIRFLGTIAVSDENGNYEAGYNLPNGPSNVSVTLTGDGWALNFINILTNVNVNCALPCTTPQNLDIAIPNLVKISGRLVDKAGRPIPNVQLVASLNNFSYFLTLTTDENGNFNGFVPVNSQGNLTWVPTFGLPPLVNVALNVGNSPVNLGDVTANTNLYYVSGTIQGYDPNNIYWRDTSVSVLATINFGPFRQITVSFSGEVFDNGSFKVPVYTNITFEWFPGEPDINFALEIVGSYRAAAADSVPLPDITQDISNVVVNVNVPATYQLIIKVEASGAPPMPMQRTFVFTASYQDRTFNISVSSDTHISSVSMFLLIFNPRGELYLYIETVPGFGEYTIEVPKELIDEPYTISYFSLETGEEKPLNAQVSSSGGIASITFTNPEGSDLIFVKITSTRIIPEFNSVLLFITVFAIALIYVVSRKLEITVSRIPSP